MTLDRVIQCQMQHFALGDQRLNQRCHQLQAQLLQQDCAQSLPRLFNEKPKLKAFYRLMNNPKLTPKALTQGYRQGLIEWASQQPTNARDRFLFLVQDSTVVRYHGRKLDIGYLQNADDNGLWLHHGILTDSDFVPLGLPIQQFIQRDRTEFGKRHSHKQRPFQQKESYKWIEGLDFAHHFEQQTGFRIMQLADAECDIAEWYNYALQHQQAFVIRAASDRRLAKTQLTLSAYLAQQPVGGQVLRPIRDASGRVHSLLCALKWGSVHLRGIDKPLGVVELRQVEPLVDGTPAHWCLLTQQTVNSLSQAEALVETYTHRWRTCEDFHKCQKTGCQLEARQFESVGALTNCIGLLSLVAVRLLRLRHQTQIDSAQAMAFSNQGEEAVAHQLSPRYLSPTERQRLSAGSIGWFWQLLARLGGHQGVSQRGTPGWQTIWKGYQYFQVLVEGYNMSKNINLPP